MINALASAYKRLKSLPRRGATIVDYAFVVAGVTVLCLAAVISFGDKNDRMICQGANILAKTTQEYSVHCEDKGFGDPAPKDFDEQGFLDLYLDLTEVTPRRVILPVSVFDVKGLDEILTSTDRENSVAACYEIAGGQVTCATMRGTDSAFDFPADVTGVGYEVLPLPDDRDVMAQPVSITLGSTKNPENNQTWNITVYREGVPNIFEPKIEFEDLKLPAGTVGEYVLMERLRGKFDRNDLDFEITPTEGEFALCMQAKEVSEGSCGLSQADPSVGVVPTDTFAIGYQMHLPMDVRVPVSWPLTIKLASPYNSELDHVSWDIVVSRISTEAPAFHELNFENVTFDADADGIRYSMVELDQEYPSDLMVSAPQGDEGLAFCYTAEEGGDPVCSPDVSVQDVALTVPAGAYSVGYATVLPEDVLTEFTRQIEFEVRSVDYPDFFKEISVANYRPSFVPIFEPTVSFPDKAFAEGQVGDEEVLVDLTGNFNSDVVLSIAAPQPGSKVCVRTAPNEDFAAGELICSGAADQSEMHLDVPLDTPFVGYSVHLGDNEFQPVDKMVQFELRNSKDPSLMVAYSVNITRPATPVIFQPNTAAMAIADVTYSEATTGWQSPHMTPLRGTFNTDLLLAMTPAMNDAEPCYQASEGDDPVCGQSIQQDSGRNGLRVPNGSYAIGVRPYLSDDIHIEQELQMDFNLSSAETTQFASPMSSLATRPSVPVKFDPNLGFRDKEFSAGLTRAQHVMVPIEGEITTGLTMNAPQSAVSLRMCYAATADGSPVCSTDAQFGSVSFDIPEGSAAVGYKVMLPDDVHEEWAHPIDFQVVSSYDETLNYDVSLTVSRESNIAVYSPSTDFSEIVFEAGTAGEQLVIKPITGDVNTRGRVIIPASGLPVSPCFQKASDSDPVCSSGTSASDARTAEPQWVATEPGEPQPRMYAAGFALTLPEDIHTDVDWTFTFRLQSTYDDTLGRDYTVHVTRPSMPVVWEPDASLKLPDSDYAVKTSGAQDQIIPFKGNFTTKTHYTISSTKQSVHPCYRQLSTGDITCGSSATGADSKVTLDPDWEFIGYRVVLPTDLAEEVDETVIVTLRSAYDPSLYMGQTFKIYREPAPVVFSPTVSFADHTFTKAETGWQRVMEPLTGNMTTDLELYATASQNILLCAQDVAGGATRCTDEASAGLEKTLKVAPTAHAIGFAVKLPEDPYVSDTQSSSFDLRMLDYPSQRRSFTVGTDRPSPDVTFTTNMNYASTSFPEGMKGWFNMMQPLSGNFSSEIEMVSTNPGDDMKLCAQETSGGAIICQASDSVMPVDKSYYAIGYALHFGEDVFAAWERTAQIELRSKPYPSVKKAWSPKITRAARNVDLPPSNLFASSNHYEAGELGERIIMAEIAGIGNAEMSFEIARAGFNVRLCIQETQADPVSCKTASAANEAQSYDITPETYKIGYRFTLPEDHFEKFEKSIDLSVISKVVDNKKQNYRISLKRDIKQPIMPEDGLFADLYYPPETAGQKTIMTQLDPKIDTRLSMQKGYNLAGIALCYQQSQSGDITCAGGNTSSNYKIVDVNDSWFAVGYRFNLPESKWDDVNETVRIDLISEDVDNVKSSYAPALVRPALETIMPGANFLPNQSYEPGTTGKQLFMAELDPDTNTELVFSKYRYQEDLELCYKTSANSAPVCAGEGINSDFEITDSSRNWHSIGYKVYLDDDVNEEVFRTLIMKVESTDVPSDYENYRVGISRFRLNATMPDRTFFGDEEFAEGKQGVVDIMEPLGSDVNIDLVLFKGANQPDVEICYQVNSTSDLSCFGKGDSAEVSTSIAQTWHSIGYRVDLGNKFVDYDEQVNLYLTARDGWSNRVDYNVRVSRPKIDLVMPRSDLFTSMVYEVGDTGYKEVFATLSPDVNTGLRLVKDVDQDYMQICRKMSEEDTPYCVGYNDSRAISLTIPIGTYAVGYTFRIPSTVYEDYSETHALALTAADANDESIRYAPTSTRAGVEILTLSDALFEDKEFLSSESGYQEVWVDIEGKLSSTMAYSMQYQPYVSVFLCQLTVSDVVDCTDSTSANSTDRYRTINVPASTKKIGYKVNTGSNKYSQFDYQDFKFMAKSVNDPNKFTEWEIDFKRQGEEVNLLSEDLFGNVEFESDRLSYQYVWKDIEGQLNTDMTLNADQQPVSVYLCYISSSNAETCTYHPSSSSVTRHRLVVVPASAKKIGYKVHTGNEQFASFDYEDFRFTLTSVENADAFNEWTIDFSRDASEIKTASQDLFGDISFSSNESGYQYVWEDIQGELTTNMNFFAQQQPVGVYLCYISESDTEKCTHYSTASGVTRYRTVEVPVSAKKIGYKVHTGNDEFFPFSYQDYTFRLESVKNDNAFTEWTIDFSRDASEIKTVSQELFGNIEFSSNKIGYQYVWKDIEGQLTTNMNFFAQQQPVGVYLCYISESDTEKCTYNSTASGTTRYRTVEVPASAKKIGYKVHTGNDEFFPFSYQDYSFRLESVKNDNAFTEWTIDFSRDASEIRTLSPDLFGDKEFASHEIGTREIWADIEGQLSTDMYYTTPQQNVSVQLCYISETNYEDCADYSATYPYENRRSVTVPASAKKLGYKVHTGTDKFYDFKFEDFSFRLESVKDDDVYTQWIIDFSRDGAEIKTVSPDLFGDKTFASNEIGTRTVLVDIEGQLSTAMELKGIAREMNGFVCVKHSSGNTSCSSNLSGQSSGQSRDVPSDAVAIGYQIYTGGDEFYPYELDSLKLSLTSVKDSSKTTSWDIAIDRPRSEIKTVSPDLFGDKTFASNAIGTQEVWANIEGQLSSPMVLKGIAREMSGFVCVKHSSGNTSCSSNLSGQSSGQSRDVPSDAVAIGYQIYTGGDEFYPYELDSLKLSLTSVKDSSKTTSWDIAIDRPRSEIKTVSPDLFGDKTFASNEIGTRTVWVDIEGQLSSPMVLKGIAREMNGFVCVKHSSGETSCSSNVYNTSSGQSRSVPADAVAIGYQIYTGADEFYPYELDSLKLSLTSVKDSSKTTSWDIAIDRPRSEIKTVSPDLFGDKTFASNAIETQEVWAKIEGQISTPMVLKGIAPDMNGYVCVERRTGDVACSDQVYNMSSGSSQGVPADAVAIGYRIFTGDDEFYPYGLDSLKLSLTSVKDSSKTTSWDIAIDRPRSEIKTVSPDLFGDKTFASNAIGTQEVWANIEGQISTPMVLKGIAPDMNGYVCVERRTGDVACSGQVYNISSGSSQGVPADAVAIGYRIFTGDDESYPYELESLKLSLTSGKDSSKTTAWDIAIDRPASAP